MTFGRKPLGRDAVARILSTPMTCQRPGCGHLRRQHYTDVNLAEWCAANRVYPHTDPETGEHVPSSHCTCPGFLAQST